MNFLKPELFLGPYTEEKAREEAEKLDQLLGFEIAQIEQNLLNRAKAQQPEGSHRTWGQAIHEGNQTWVGLSHQTLQTPYTELGQICELIRPGPGSLLLDLGAGYGRMGLVLQALYPESFFLGLEYVRERVEEGSRILEKLECTHAKLLQQDLTHPDFTLPKADYYFLYDYGTVAHIKKTLTQFEAMSAKKNFKLIARGKGIRSLIQQEHPWLCQVYPPIHEENFSIYSMSETL